MAEFDASLIVWREPWYAISADYSQKADAELRREMCAGHVLFGRPVKAVGQRQDRDDFLFYLGECAPSFAVVHLTFQRETDPRWPDTTLFDSLTSWIEGCMIPDAEDFAD